MQLEHQQIDPRIFVPRSICKNWVLVKVYMFPNIELPRGKFVVNSSSFLFKETHEWTALHTSRIEIIARQKLFFNKNLQK